MRCTILGNVRGSARTELDIYILSSRLQWAYHLTTGTPGMYHNESMIVNILQNHWNEDGHAN
jgi:hypothetical protein